MTDKNSGQIRQFMEKKNQIPGKHFEVAEMEIVSEKQIQVLWLPTIIRESALKYQGKQIHGKV